MDLRFELLTPDYLWSRFMEKTIVKAVANFVKETIGKFF
jgi:hypothetical protein